MTSPVLAPELIGTHEAARALHDAICSDSETTDIPDAMAQFIDELHSKYGYDNGRRDGGFSAWRPSTAWPGNDRATAPDILQCGGRSCAIVERRRTMDGCEIAIRCSEITRVPALVCASASQWTPPSQAETRRCSPGQPGTGQVDDERGDEDNKEREKGDRSDDRRGAACEGTDSGTPPDRPNFGAAPPVADQAY